MVTYTCVVVFTYKISGAPYSIKYVYTSQISAASIALVRTAFMAEILALTSALGTGQIYYYEFDYTLIPAP